MTGRWIWGRRPLTRARVLGPRVSGTLRAIFFERPDPQMTCSRDAIRASGWEGHELGPAATVENTHRR
jgi:hypothetical protein